MIPLKTLEERSTGLSLKMSHDGGGLQQSPVIFYSISELYKEDETSIV
jgi:hypothetical protein